MATQPRTNTANNLRFGLHSHARQIGSLGHWGAKVGLLGALIFLSAPQLDLRISELFYSGSGRFIGQSNYIANSLRYAFIVTYVAACLIALLALMLPSRIRLRLTTLSTTHCIFAVLCLATGPGLVANLTFKDHWGRARPRHVLEFGGQKAFTPPLVMSDSCQSNCSFVSGEASSIFILFFLAAALYHQHAKALIAGGVLFGGLAGLVRVSQGAHFLSDVLFAGVFMGLTVAALYVAFDRVVAIRRAPVHAALLKMRVSR